MTAEELVLTRILTPSCVYLIDTGNEGRARDSSPPPPPARPPTPRPARPPPQHVAETRYRYRDSSGLPVRNRSPGGWGGGGRESRRACLSFPVSIRYTQDGVRIRVKTSSSAVTSLLIDPKMKITYQVGISTTLTVD